MSRPIQLILISGPVASGKTTVARELANNVRQNGKQASAIDMDEMIEAVAGVVWAEIRTSDRVRACHATAAFADSLFNSGTELVTISGSTLSSYEWDEVTTLLRERPVIQRVLLRVSIEESIRRAQSDASRIATQDPDFVRRLSANIDWSSVRTPDLDIQTDSLTVAQVVEQIVSWTAS